VRRLFCALQSRKGLMSIYREASLSEFKEALDYDWRPMWAGIAEDDDTGDDLQAIDVDLVCEYRVQDGKRLFLRVPALDETARKEVSRLLVEATERFASEQLEKFKALGVS
jgi:hypothetical protein